MAASVALIALSACGGDDGGPTGTNNNGNGTVTGDGNITATINGVAWRSLKSGDRGSKSGQFYAVVGVSSNYTLTLGIGNLTGPSTVSLDLAAGGNGSSAIVANASGGWGTAFSGGTGTIVVTTLTANRIVGTFSFDAKPGSGGATGTLQVRNGKFDVTF
jgi:hypothetical protein